MKYTLEVRKFNRWWYVVKVFEDDHIEAVSAFTTKRVATRAMEGYKEWMK